MFIPQTFCNRFDTSPYEQNKYGCSWAEPNMKPRGVKPHKLRELEAPKKNVYTLKPMVVSDICP
jgi:hypothetical protein